VPVPVLGDGVIGLCGVLRGVLNLVQDDGVWGLRYLGVL